MSPPPSSTARFSKYLRPGSVFLVHAILILSRLSLLAIDTRSAVDVATPDMWDSRFNKVRSTPSNARAGPRAERIIVPAFTRPPSRVLAVPWQPTSSRRITASSIPAITAFSLQTTRPSPLRSESTRTLVVMSPYPRSSAKNDRIAFSTIDLLRSNVQRTPFFKRSL